MLKLAYDAPGSVCSPGGGPGLKNQAAAALSIDASIDSPKSSDSEPTTETAVLASCLALFAEKSPDLALIAERWDALPEAVRTGIVAMVKASSRSPT